MGFHKMLQGERKRRIEHQAGVRHRKMGGGLGRSIARVGLVKEWIAGRRHRKGFVLLPVALLGLLLIQLVVLPAVGMPAHEAVMSSPAASADISGEHPAQNASGSHDHAKQAGHDHGESDGPLCHAADPHYADMVPGRSWEDDLAKLGLGVLLAVTAAGMLAAVLSVPRPPPHSDRWCSRPPWRPSGVDLLTRVCIART